MAGLSRCPKDVSAQVLGPGFRVWGLRVVGLGFRVWGLRVVGLGFRAV